MGWDNELAQHFKDRDNKEYIGTIIGEVISTAPFKVSAFEGSILIDGSICYVTKTAKAGINVGDKVLVITSESNQLYFVVDKLEKFD